MKHFQRITIEFEKTSTFDSAKGLVTAWSYGKDCAASQAADEKIDKLIQEGWEIVAAVPLVTTQSLNKEVERHRQILHDVYPQTITEAIEVLLVKRK